MTGSLSLSILHPSQRGHLLATSSPGSMCGFSARGLEGRKRFEPEAQGPYCVESAWRRLLKCHLVPPPAPLCLPLPPSSTSQTASNPIGRIYREKGKKK